MSMQYKRSLPVIRCVHVWDFSFKVSHVNYDAHTEGSCNVSSNVVSAAVVYWFILGNYFKAMLQ